MNPPSPFSTSPEVLAEVLSTNSPSHSPDPTVNAGASDAEKPFNASARADVILRSSDSVDFFVLKAILCIASPVFDNMFSITQENNERESMNKTKNGLPVVDLAEDSATLYDLLPQLYPYPKEITDTLGVYIRVGKAAEKYAMDELIQNLKRLIMNCGPMTEDPVAAFAVAVHLGWVDVMKEAALDTLAIPLRNLHDLISGDGQSEFLRFISAMDYRALLSWRLACQKDLDMLFARWTTDAPHMRRILGSHLSRRLKDTGCARSTVLMDDRFVSSETMKAIYANNASRGLTKKDIEDAHRSIMKDIENAVSKVPLKINGIVLQAGD